MHFVFGGAFNGKRKWVKDTYKEQGVIWISAYEQAEIPKSVEAGRVTVFEGVEVWVRELIVKGFTVKEASAFLEQAISRWDKQCDRLVLIGTEIGKGIVPMEEEDRMWRDACGYVYQLIVKKADRVDQIWYGIPTRLKGEERR
ncbi:bifunctional adenosylcobinamide kinase/adenosylcobinamide-phosphate guanylyltransferase [Priestia abyssalis]|uniref:bifunctional adenosylcobinamide kinase/adenosylcobinamide-phosphate guanylyltransferase n=1 Tax=Priestia abyssalis TaxID=1221450 RepID=UPI00099522C7|nr:bifunctional adenosylcobinamide kinase/adenosylcobinamide-phosphate guanylyltransferase [Priestia abyssalis]